jgi:hypothetical protein
MPRVTGPAVVAAFLTAIAAYGPPAATLTDNGAVYTARFTGGRNAFEYLLRDLGIAQRNGRPSHPQTQGKIERFHQTLKRWLAAQTPAPTIADLQQQLDQFTDIYNNHRRHRAHAQTPAAAYNGAVKAEPAPIASDPAHYRIRVDAVDRFGKLTLRRAGKLHHLGIGARHTGTPVLVLVNDTTVDVIDPSTGELLSTHDINPNRDYWPNNRRNPGRWPGLP